MPSASPSPSPSPREPLPAADLDWSQALRSVLAERELIRPVFQPIVDLERGVACGYEMLARFHAPFQAPPPVWFAQAERLGVGIELEAALVEIGLDALDSAPENCFLTINVSPRALAHDRVASVLASRASLEGAVIEVTEQAAVEDYGDLDAVLTLLRSQGAAIAVDDAGAGYASLQHIVALRPQFVKLDRSLVADLDRDEAKLAVIESLGTFSSRIDAWMVAEGVEQAEEVAALQRLRVPLAQGFWLGRPDSAMTPLASDRERAIRSARPAPAAEARIASIVEPAPTAAYAAGAEGIAQVFNANPGLAHLPLLDGSRRPMALVGRDGFLAGDPRGSAPMRVELSEELPAVARRAMTRPQDERFEPVLCCDPRGRYVGVVKVERLIEGLAAIVETDIKEKQV